MHIFANIPFYVPASAKVYQVSYLHAEIKRFRPTFHTRREANSMLSVLETPYCVLLTLSILQIYYVHIRIKENKSLTPTQDVCILRCDAKKRAILKG